MLPPRQNPDIPLPEPTREPIDQPYQPIAQPRRKLKPEDRFAIEQALKISLPSDPDPEYEIYRSSP